MRMLNLYIRSASVVLLTLMCASAQAQISTVPGTMNFQGNLYQSDGKTPVAGPVDLEVRVYTNKADDVANAIWGELHTGTTLYQGIFNIPLGGGTVLGALNHGSLDDLFAQAGLWLGFTVVGENDERPERQQLVSAPYALTANTAITAVHGVPAGTIAMWCGPTNTIPFGWLPCNGASVLRAPDANNPNTPAYPELFAAIGTTWGQGATAGTTFGLPNFGGRALMCESFTASGTNSNSPGQVPSVAGLVATGLGFYLGAETHTLIVSELPSHTHTNRDYYSSGSDNASGGLQSPTPYVGRSTRSRTSGSTGGGEAHPNMQPSIVITWIIKSSSESP